MTVLSLLVAMVISPVDPGVAPERSESVPSHSIAPADSGDTGDTGDTGGGDTGTNETGDTAPSVDSGETDDTGVTPLDSNDTGAAETGDTADTAEGSDTGDTSDTADSGGGETYSSAELAGELGGCGCSGGPLELSWLLVGLGGVASVRRRRRES